MFNEQFPLTFLTLIKACFSPLPLLLLLIDGSSSRLNPLPLIRWEDHRAQQILSAQSEADPSGSR